MLYKSPFLACYSMFTVICEEKAASSSKARKHAVRKQAETGPKLYGGLRGADATLIGEHNVVSVPSTPHPTDSNFKFHISVVRVQSYLK